MSNHKPTFGRTKAHFETKNQILPNALIFSNLCDTSVRLIAALNALPDNWVINQEDIKKRLGWGRERMDNAVKDCVAKGYMRVTQTKLENGRYGSNHYEYDTKPTFLETCEENSLDNDFEPLPGFPTPDEGTSENTHNSSSYEYSSLKEERKTDDSFLPFSPIEEEQKKIELLKKYNLDATIVFKIIQYPFEQVQTSLLAYEQWVKKRGKPPLDINAPIMKAVANAWKPSITAEEIQAAQEDEVSKFQALIQSRKEHIKQMEKTAEGKLPFKYSIKAGENEVQIRLDNAWVPVSYAEDDVIQIVQKHINKHGIEK